MKIEDFAQIAPQCFGTGTVSLLYTGSVGNYTILGISFPAYSKNGENLYSKYGELESIKFKLNGDATTLTIVEKRREENYFFFQVEEQPLAFTVSESYMNVTGQDTITDTKVSFSPYVDITFETSDRNPTIGNAMELLTSNLVYVVDRESNQVVPSNLSAILLSTASPANIPDSFYSSVGIRRSRYEGAKLNSGSVIGDDPALTFRSFKGSVHLVDASTSVLKSGSIEKDEGVIYFNVGTNLTDVFPVSGSSYLYREEGNNLVRMVTSKVFISELEKVITLDNMGNITLEE